MNVFPCGFPDSQTAAESLPISLCCSGDTDPEERCKHEPEGGLIYESNPVGKHSRERLLNKRTEEKNKRKRKELQGKRGN